MAKESTLTVERIMASGDLRSRVESVICDRCQDLCWSVEVWAYDLAGEDAKACLFYREHFGSQSDALLTVARWLLKHAGAIRSREDAAWLLEHQGTLW